MQQALHGFCTKVASRRVLDSPCFSEGSKACRSLCGAKGGVDPDKGKATVGDKVRLESSDPRKAQKSRESAFRRPDHAASRAQVE